MGKLLAICTSPKRGTVKTEVPSAVLTPEWGIVEDAHGGNWHRQVSMLSAEKIETFRKKIWVDYGAFGENLVIEGFDFRNLPVTSRFAIGDVVLEMTQIGKECHNDCVIKQQTGECIMPHEGVFARVLTGGEIHVGDEICGSLAVEAQLLFVMVTVTNFLILQAKRMQPVQAEALPVCKPLKVCVWLAEEFKLHLLELTGTEGEVSRCNLVTEGFTDLADTKRNLLTGGSLYVLEVYEDTLCCLRS